MNQIDMSDPTAEVLEMLPRKLLTCITSSPKRAAMAALIPSLTIRVTRYPEDWMFESAKAREQLERIAMILSHLAPTSLEVTAYQDGHPWVTAHILERLDVSQLRSFDPGYAAYGRGQVDHLPFCHGVLVRCASTIQRLYFPQSHFPDPDVNPPPAMPQLRRVAVGNLFGEYATPYILAALRVAPALSALQLSIGGARELTGRMLPILSASRCLASLWIADLRDDLAGPVDWINDDPVIPLYDLSQLVHLRTLTIGKLWDGSFSNSLPPHLHHLRIRFFYKDDPEEHLALRGLIECLLDSAWQPGLTSLTVQPAYHLDRPDEASYNELHSLLVCIAEQRGVRVEQRDSAWWQEEEFKGW